MTKKQLEFVARYIVRIEEAQKEAQDLAKDPGNKYKEFDDGKANGLALAVSTIKYMIREKL
jgi:hypothetical protein